MDFDRFGRAVSHSTDSLQVRVPLQALLLQGKSIPACSACKKNIFNIYIYIKLYISKLYYIYIILYNIYIYIIYNIIYIYMLNVLFMCPRNNRKWHCVNAQREAKNKHVRLPFQVCDLCHQWSVRPPAKHLANWVVVSSKPTNHQTQPHPPHSHTGSWVGWVENRRTALQYHRFRLAQREGVFQSGEICGKS